MGWKRGGVGSPDKKRSDRRSGLALDADHQELDLC